MEAEKQVKIDRKLSVEIHGDNLREDTIVSNPTLKIEKPIEKLTEKIQFEK